MSVALRLASIILVSGGDCEPKRYRVDETNMTSVTVFVDRAEVTRVLRVELDTVCPFSVLLHGLPETLEPGSIRADFEGPTTPGVDQSPKWLED